MANEENLKKGKATRFKSGEQAASAGRKGGRASGASKRRNKDLKARLRELMQFPVEDEKFRKVAKKAGFKDEDLTNYDIYIARLYLKAMSGDVRALQMVAEYMGETPQEKRAQEAHEAAMKDRKQEEGASGQINIINDIPREKAENTETATFNAYQDPEESKKKE